MKKQVIIAAPATADELSVWPGADILSLHISDAEKYQAIVDKYSKKAVVQINTESFGAVPSNELIAKVKALKPSAVALALRDFMPRPDYEIEAEEFFAWVKENGVAAQYVLYNTDELRYFADLLDQRIIPEGDNFVMFVLGRNQQSGKPYELDTYMKVLKDIGLQLDWVASAVGDNESECLEYALQKGGGISVSSKLLLKKLLKKTD